MAEVKIAKLESIVARKLETWDIPCMMWGEPVLALYGVAHANITHSSWVIPDEDIKAAADLLEAGGFRHLENEIVCRGESAPPPIPDYTLAPPPYAESEFPVALYRKSRLLWTFPPMVTGEPMEPDYYMTTFDERLSSAIVGRDWQLTGMHHSMVIPTPEKYIEAMLLLQIRDLDGHAALNYWRRSINHLVFEVLLQSDSPQLDWSHIQSPWLECLQEKKNREQDADLHEGDSSELGTLVRKIYIWLKEAKEIPAPEGIQSPRFKWDLFKQGFDELGLKVEESYLTGPTRKPENMREHDGLSSYLRHLIYRDE
ncbi:hypothetical protein BO71DRAFT_431935 [Aspergillus ellipticus CBS 707.79]|uniref:Uncharacterized protein n=1 Tax=Aspergillus ellipticus CBS 707.79 TaxID=1448320 RepID=A0A319D5F7_9EURO|nr:hypothetical protein BO71DRAFT_431935 [Aspergillus ellipticus CBS 707.79]